MDFSGKDIIFRVRDKKGDLVDIVKQADVNLVSYGTIPVTPGRKTIIVKSLGSSVLVQIPCKNDDIICVTPTSYSACNGVSCGIKCENSAWTIKITCPLPGSPQNTVCDSSGPDFICGLPT